MRNIVAGIALIVGLVLMLGSIGQLEVDKVANYGEFWLRAGIGIALCAIAIPISNTEKGDNNRS